MKRKKLMRILALVVVLAMLVAMVIEVVLSSRAEEASNSYELELTFSEDMEALHAVQRFTFYNDTGDRLSRVMFAFYVNLLKSSLNTMYEDASAFDYGFSPSGAALTSVKVNGEAAEWAFTDDKECFLRVMADIPAGESAVFEFEYEVLLSENRAFCGFSGTDVRLSKFCPLVCVYNEGIWEGNSPVQHSRFALTTPADWEVTLLLPEDYTAAGTGACEAGEAHGGVRKWTVKAEAIREFSLVISRVWREYSAFSAMGTEIKVYSSSRIYAKKALSEAVRTADIYESMFGKLPRDIIIAECDFSNKAEAYSGLIWLDSSLFTSSKSEKRRYYIRRALAEQYFGLEVYSDPLADSWMCASLCEYISYLALEEEEGTSAMLKKLNSDVLPALQVTIPGDLFITADGILFTQSEYDTVVKERGAAAMHFMRGIMGREEFISALRYYYESCRGKKIVTEMDFLDALNHSSGRDLESTLTDILFNIDEYSNQPGFEFDQGGEYK